MQPSRLLHSLEDSLITKWVGVEESYTSVKITTPSQKNKNKNQCFTSSYRYRLRDLQRYYHGQHKHYFCKKKKKSQKPRVFPAIIGMTFQLYIFKAGNKGFSQRGITKL